MQYKGVSVWDGTSTRCGANTIKAIFALAKNQTPLAPPSLIDVPQQVTFVNDSAAVGWPRLLSGMISCQWQHPHADVVHVSRVSSLEITK